jgi:hypothetical protein
MSLSLYQLSGDYLTALQDLTDPELGLEDVVIKDTLESLSGDFEVKAQNVAMFIRNLETTAEAIKQAESDMAKRRKAIENRAMWLKSYLKGNMELTGISKIECPYFKLSLAKNPASVELIDESIIPEEFKRTETVITIDKTAIKTALSSGQCVPGAKLTNGTRLVIR